MKLGVISLNLLNLDFEEGLAFANRCGIQAIEIGAAGGHDLGYCNPDHLLADRSELTRWLDMFARYEIEISAFSAHGAPLSSDTASAAEESRRFRQVCRLAEACGVTRLTLLAGLPPGGPNETIPCWAWAPFPAFHQEIRQWQWEERVLPYWTEHAKIAENHGVRLCFEPQMSDFVHNPHELMKLRAAIGPVVGCNLDPSHLMYQGIDVLEAIRYLGEAIYHVHLKDVRPHRGVVSTKGFLDSTPLPRTAERSWSFALPGWGHDALFWRSFIDELRLIGYDHALSLEMEVDEIELSEGIEHAAAFIKPLLLGPQPKTTWWQLAGLEM